MFSTGSARIGLDKLAAGAETSAAIFLKIKTMELVSVKSLNVAFGAKTVFDGLDWSVSKGENWAISGESGSGKTCLLKALAGKIEHGGTVEINFAETSAPKEALYVENWYKFVNLEGDRNFYYQQRYNYHAEHDTLTVFAELEKFGGERGLDIAKLEPILAGFGFEKCRQTQLIELSSGEHKKLQLVRALWLKPQILLLDDPYTGLDAKSRAALNDILDSEAADGTTVIIVTNDTELPKSVNKFAKISDGKILPTDRPESVCAAEIVHKPVPAFLKASPEIPSQVFIQARNVSVKYGEKTILDNVSWTVRAGEKWLLQGHNGSGKSTLLSLVCGDNPQAYGNDIELFGKPRGSGESIWDIKKKMGIISPEMHWYFDQNATVWNSVASGLLDTMGWFLDVSFSDAQKIDQTLEFFDLKADRDTLLTSLPLGKQRLALLARTVVKNPPLLILDEPCQGLDAAQRNRFNAAIDDLGEYGKTIIYVGHYETRLPKCLNHKLELEKGRVLSVQ